MGIGGVACVVFCCYRGSVAFGLFFRVLLAYGHELSGSVASPVRRAQGGDKRKEKESLGRTPSLAFQLFIYEILKTQYHYSILRTRDAWFKFIYATITIGKLIKIDNPTLKDLNFSPFIC